jgi:hypothetical protein
MGARPYLTTPYGTRGVSHGTLECPELITEHLQEELQKTGKELHRDVEVGALIQGNTFSDESDINELEALLHATSSQKIVGAITSRINKLPWECVKTTSKADEKSKFTIKWTDSVAGRAGKQRNSKELSTHRIPTIVHGQVLPNGKGKISSNQVTTRTHETSVNKPRNVNKLNKAHKILIVGDSHA